MENLEPGGKSPIEHIEIAMNQTMGFFTQMIAKGLQGIEQMSGAGKTITDLPEGIVDVGAYFLLQEPGKEGYSLQVNKKHLLRGMNDSKSGTEAIRYMSSTDKQNISQKIIRLRALHDLLCQNRINIGFSKTMKHDYFVLNRLDNKTNKSPDRHSAFMKELLQLIHCIYKGNLEELYNDMAIIRQSIMHQGGVNSDPYEYYKEWSRDPKHVAERAQTDELRQHIKGRKALLILMEEIEHYPFKSLKDKYKITGGG